MLFDLIVLVVEGENQSTNPIVEHHHFQRDCPHLTLLCQPLRLNRDHRAKATARFGNWRMPTLTGCQNHWVASTLSAYTYTDGCTDAHAKLSRRGSDALTSPGAKTSNTGVSNAVQKHKCPATGWSQTQNYIFLEPRCIWKGHVMKTNVWVVIEHIWVKCHQTVWRSPGVQVKCPCREVD